MSLRRWWEAHFFPLELLASVVLAAFFVVWSEYFNERQFINAIILDSREVIYGTLASLFGSLLGFSITAVSIALGYATSDRLAVVRQSKRYLDLWEIFKSAIRVLGAATIFALIGLFFDKDTVPNIYILYANVFMTILSFFRMARCIWILENIIIIVTKSKN
jgi:hypothetical protein